MADTQTASITLQASANSVADGRNTSAGITTQTSVTNGTATGLANKAYYSKQTIAGTAYPVNLDFVGTSLIDLNGDAVSWAEMVYLMVKADSANTVNIVVGNASNPIDFGQGSTANTISLKPGETKVLICCPASDPGYVLANGSADTLKLTIASGANQIVEIFAIGRDA